MSADEPGPGSRLRWPRPLARPAVLVVDDDPALREVLRIAYESSGWGVLEAENGHEGVLAAIEHRPDLLVLDLLMPVLGGFQALQQLDDLGILDRTVVVILSGVEDGPILRRASQALGVRQVWTKPVDPLELVVETMGLVTADGVPRP